LRRINDALPVAVKMGTMCETPDNGVQRRPTRRTHPMTRSRKTPQTLAMPERAARSQSLVQAAPLPEESGELEPGHERMRARPDGYYWQALDGNQEIGPFKTLAEAQADMDSGDAQSWSPGETLSEAESEIGIADWIDPDSGGPAEGHSPPHLGQE
jgi:hypothetical protein